jgi:hypothetical protein
VASRERVSADYTVLEFRIAHEWEAEHRLAALALGRDAGAFVGFLSEYIIPLLRRFIKILSTPKRAARVIHAFDQTVCDGIDVPDLTI